MNIEEKLALAIEALEALQNLKDEDFMITKTPEDEKEFWVRDMSVYAITYEALSKINQPQTVAGKRKESDPRWPLDRNHNVVKNGKLISTCDTEARARETAKECSGEYVCKMLKGEEYINTEQGPFPISALGKQKGLLDKS